MLYRESEVLSQSQDGATLELEIRIAPAVAGRLLQIQGVELVTESEQ